MTQVFGGVIRAGLVLGAGALPLVAQGLALPAADPVGIARSGAQVAYGFSLEAASANPALLASLKEKGGIYLATGVHLTAFQQSLESNQRTYESQERNRTIQAFGLSLRLTPKLTLGMKLDEPYLRHGRLPDDAPSRYLGSGLALSVRRMEAQAAWAYSPNVSFGMGLGVARMAFESSNVMTLGVPNPLPAGPVFGLVEHRVSQSGSKSVPSYSLGMRWAISPRWTLGFTRQSALKGDLDLKARFEGAPLQYRDNDGLGAPPLGVEARATGLLAASRAVPGNGTMVVPSQTAFGVRHRLHPMVTWEADLRWTSSSLLMPGFAKVQTPSGTISASSQLPGGKGYLSLSASAEVELGKRWTLRGGFALTQRSTRESDTEPLLGGGRTAAFSTGAGLKAWGGEFNLGYQYRQSEDQDRSHLGGNWSATGFHPSPTRVRMEGMGHLLAFGFKKMF